MHGERARAVAGEPVLVAAALRIHCRGARRTSSRREGKSGVSDRCTGGPEPGFGSSPSGARARWGTSGHGAAALLAFPSSSISVSAREMRLSRATHQDTPSASSMIAATRSSSRATGTSRSDCVPRQGPRAQRLPMAAKCTLPGSSASHAAPHTSAPCHALPSASNHASKYRFKSCSHAKSSHRDSDLDLRPAIGTKHGSEHGTQLARCPGATARKPLRVKELGYRLAYPWVRSVPPSNFVEPSTSLR